jgi:hypothetical protein
MSIYIRQGFHEAFQVASWNDGLWDSFLEVFPLDIHLLVYLIKMELSWTQCPLECNSFRPGYSGSVSSAGRVRSLE